MIREKKTYDKEEKVQKNPSIKNQEFKNKSVKLTATFASKLEQIDQYRR